MLNSLWVSCRSKSIHNSYLTYLPTYSSACGYVGILNCQFNAHPSRITFGAVSSSGICVKAMECPCCWLVSSHLKLDEQSPSHIHLNFFDWCVLANVQWFHHHAFDVVDFWLFAHIASATISFKHGTSTQLFWHCSVFEAIWATPYKSNYLLVLVSVVSILYVYVCAGTINLI